MTDSDGNDSGAEQANIAAVGQPSKVRPMIADKQLHNRHNHGRRTLVHDTHAGHYVRAAIPHAPIRRFSDLALDATLRAAAMSIANCAYPLRLQPHHLRQKIREARAANLILFVVDASGSMAARQRMSAVKGAILSLLLDAYQKRDRVGMITFRGRQAELLLSPTNSVDIAHQQLTVLPTGGRTPLTDALVLAQRVIRQHSGEEPALLILLSDGRANIPFNQNEGDAIAEANRMAKHLSDDPTSIIVIDCETGYRRLALARDLAQSLDAEYILLANLADESLANVVRQRGEHPQKMNGYSRSDFDSTPNTQRNSYT